MQKFCTIFCNPFLQTQSVKTSRDPTPKCHTFLKTSCDPQLESQLKCKILQIFCNQILQPHNRNTFKDPKVIPFWNLDLTLYLIPSSLYPCPLTLALNLTQLHLSPYPFYPLPIYLGCDFIDTSLVILSKLHHQLILFTILAGIKFFTEVVNDLSIALELVTCQQ